MATNVAYCKTNRECICNFESRAQQRANLNEDAANQNNDAREDVKSTQDGTQTQPSNEE